MTPRRRTSLITAMFAIAATTFSVSGSEARAAGTGDYPTRPVELVVPYPPGGLTDRYARVVAEGLQKRWGKPVVVQNRAGANGLIGTQYVRNALPDGHTLLFTSSSAHVAGPLAHPALPFHPVEQFTPVTMAMRYPMYLVMDPGLGVDSVQAFVALERQKPGRFNCGSAGVGSATHLACELFNTATGTRLLHVGYKGAVAAQMAVAAGEVQVMFDSVGQSQKLVEAGKLRGIAVTDTQRSKAVPDIPTLAESGYPDFVAYNWLGLFAPAGLPADLLAKLNSDVTGILRTEAVSASIQADGSTVVANPPDDFRRDIANEFKMWSNLIRDKNLKFN